MVGKEDGWNNVCIDECEKVPESNGPNLTKAGGDDEKSIVEDAVSKNKGWVGDMEDDEDFESPDTPQSPPKVSPLLPIETGIPRLKLEGLSLIVKSPRSQNSCSSPDLSKSLDITSPRSAFSKTSARSTLTNSSTGSY